MNMSHVKKSTRLRCCSPMKSQLVQVVPFVGSTKGCVDGLKDRAQLAFPRAFAIEWCTGDIFFIEEGKNDRVGSFWLTSFVLFLFRFPLCSKSNQRRQVKNQ